MSPYLQVVATATLFGTVGIFIKILHLPSTSVSFFRLVVPTVLLSIYFGYKRNNIFKNTTKGVLFVSLLNAIRIFLWLFAYLHTSVGNGVIILNTWPIFTVLLSSIMLKEKITKQKLLLVLLAFVGITIIFSNKEFSFQNKDFLGMLSMLFAAMLGAVTTISWKKQLVSYSTSESIFYQNLVGACLFLPFIFINSPKPSLNQTIVAIIYSLIVGLIAYIFWFSALKKIRASTLAIISYIEVVSAVVLAAIVLKEGITLNMAMGGGIILVVSYLARIEEKKNESF